MSAKADELAVDEEEEAMALGAVHVPMSAVVFAVCFFLIENGFSLT